MVRIYVYHTYVYLVIFTDFQADAGESAADFLFFFVYI